MPSLGEQLKALRIKKGMTQEQLAQKLNTTKAAISRYERDKRQPRLAQITEIATILDASADELYYLFLGSSEFEDDRGEYATRMNAISKWTEFVAGAKETGDMVDTESLKAELPETFSTTIKPPLSDEIKRSLISALERIPPAAWPLIVDYIECIADECQINARGEGSYMDGYREGVRIAQKVKELLEGLSDKPKE